ncbi:MAG TPA: NAD(P)-binding protein, partial [Acidimicrobiales bacterium]
MRATGCAPEQTAPSPVPGRSGDAVALPEEDQFDVVVIGAGYGGAPLAALLAHQGRRVALIDKTPRAGGKTQTLDRRGYRYEMFGAVGIPAVGSRFDELVEVLGIEDRVSLLVPEGHAASIRFRAPDGTWRSQRSPL